MTCRGHIARAAQRACSCEIVIEVKNAIKQVKKQNYKNYFENAYNKNAYKDYVKKDSTLKRNPKNYKE